MKTKSIEELYNELPPIDLVENARYRYKDAWDNKWQNLGIIHIPNLYFKVPCNCSISVVNLDNVLPDCCPSFNDIELIFDGIGDKPNSHYGYGRCPRCYTIYWAEFEL
jgi:hypothetical protein